MIFFSPLVMMMILLTKLSIETKTTGKLHEMKYIEHAFTQTKIRLREIKN